MEAADVSKNIDGQSDLIIAEHGLRILLIPPLLIVTVFYLIDMSRQYVLTGFIIGLVVSACYIVREVSIRFLSWWDSAVSRFGETGRFLNPLSEAGEAGHRLAEWLAAEIVEALKWGCLLLTLLFFIGANHLPILLAYCFFKGDENQLRVVLVCIVDAVMTRPLADLLEPIAYRIEVALRGSN